MSPHSDGGDTPAERIAQSWVSNAAAWTRAVRERRIESRREGTDSAIVEAITACTPAQVLDVGCGEGWLCRALASRGIRVHGVDSSAPLLERARDAGDGDFHLATYDALVHSPELLRGPFDAIVCNFALLEKDVAHVLGALASRLADGGRLLIQTAHPTAADGSERHQDGWRTETFDSFGEEFPTSMPWYFRTPGSWMSEISRAGLRVVERREPVHTGTGRPLSMILICARAAA